MRHPMITRSSIRLCGTVAALTLLSVCVEGCTSPRALPPTTSKAAASLPLSIQWFRDSAEQKALYTQVYRNATSSARALSAGLQPHKWGVILDVDETILDNSTYQRDQALRGVGYTRPSWDAWVRTMSAPRLPGVKEFIDAVRGEMGGQIIIVTNRTEAQCAATEENLRRQEIEYERILCDTAGNGDKNPRFHAVTEGAAGLAPVKVVIWMGDNIKDFPDLSQAAPGDLLQFGVQYFVLPNPMYGSWEHIQAQ